MRNLPAFKLCSGVAAAAAVFSLCAAITPVAAADVKAVTSLDLKRYVGSWREIASIPQFFQRKCARDTTATYAVAENGLLRVENVCARADGGEERAEGRARRLDPAEPAKLEVTFLNLFGDYRFWFKGDYWVLALDPNYAWAFVGHPSRRYGWLLARDAKLEPAMLAEAVKQMKLQGYDVCNLLVTPQTGGLTTRQPLCEITQ